MSCIITYNGQNFTQEDFLDYLKSQIPTSNIIKPGVEEVFQENPELASIGTQQQYSAYLDTIFPDSKVKDIVYHGSSEKFENFKDEKLGTSTKAKDTDRGHAFSNSKEVAKTYGNNIYSSILNTKNIVEVSPISGESSEFKNEYTSLKEDIDSLEKNLKYNTLITDSKDLPLEYSSYSKKIKRILNIKKEGLNFIAYLDGKKIKELTKEEALAAWNTEDRKSNIERVKKELSVLKNELTTFKYKNISDPRNLEDLKGDVYFARGKQIHILGSKADIEGFKDFVSKNGSNPSSKNETNTEKKIEPIKPQSKDFITNKVNSSFDKYGYVDILTSGKNNFDFKSAVIKYILKDLGLEFKSDKELNSYLIKEKNEGRTFNLMQYVTLEELPDNKTRVKLNKRNLLLDSVEDFKPKSLGGLNFTSSGRDFESKNIFKNNIEQAFNCK